MTTKTDETLEPGMLLKCSRCHEWHEEHHHEGNAGTTTAARDMLYWTCRGDRFFAGNVGGAARRPVVRRVEGVDKLSRLGRP